MYHSLLNREEFSEDMKFSVQKMSLNRDIQPVRDIKATKRQIYRF